MPASASRILQADEFGALPPLAQWNLLESSFRDLRVPGPGKFVPMVFIMAVQLMTGHLWCLAWLITALAGVALSRHVAEQFEQRASDATVSYWAARYSVAVWWQAAALGAGGFAATWDDHPIIILMVACPIGFAIMEVCGTALLSSTARTQTLTLIAPLVATCVMHGLLARGAFVDVGLGALFALWAVGSVPIADRAASRIKRLAMTISEGCQSASALSRDLAAPPCAEDFQKLLGRDQVTGLPNRHSFARLLAQESARASRAEAPLSLVLLGWDDYEKYSAWRTPHALDAKLADIAKRLRGQLRRQSDLLASLGAGRFGVILPATDAFGATIVARNLQEALGKQEPDMPSGLEAPLVRMSIGAATYRGKGELPEMELLEFAEEALRDARNTGGNQIRRYDPAVKGLRPASGRTKPQTVAPPRAARIGDGDVHAVLPGVDLTGVRAHDMPAITKDVLGL